MARHFRRTSRRTSVRRKTSWSQSSLGISGSLANTGVVTGWLAFPAGQYNTGFTIPAFQPEDLTHVKSYLQFGGIFGNRPSVDRASTVTFGIGLLAFEVVDGNVYQNALISSSGIGGVPNPATNNNFDWLWQQRGIVATHLAGGLVNFWTVEQESTVSGTETRAMRKLSHGVGLLLCLAWDWTNPTFSHNGDTWSVDTSIVARSLFKEP